MMHVGNMLLLLGCGLVAGGPGVWPNHERDDLVALDRLILKGRDRCGLLQGT